MTARALAVFCALLASPALADADLPPGLQSARLLPGWQTESGTRMSALELVLEPDWKTYWRVPGDTGITPSFDWSAASNVGEVVFHWPAPEVITSDGEKTLGFHDRLVLPFEVSPKQEGQPIELAADVTFGLCENICVPAEVHLTAPAPGDGPDPEIEAALENVPQQAAEQPDCQIKEISDGIQVSVTLPATPAPEAVAMELTDRPDVWISSATVAGDATAKAEFVAPDGKPFKVNTDALLVTLITPEGATELRGCGAVDQPDG